ncbi:TlpA disulfide reductase family protein [Botrimarina mediterranea]|uniref:Thiol-disulfide oxidoreductase ResA n=1 Tax=Botrimarina mediterranea TaxID=2528022 RepID=A0A518K338_9BACT|nr:TlpA disulfide reductase family protein [Botrimarina mediterranea]QDV72214.1 Thiol-disulfide oxidoreductase ResA [Botrimarina mediterranea]QDV76758.1 Thiol-disulfide oxidoreductase ResA [Planctomycetes bacterium K2D]
MRQSVVSLLALSLTMGVMAPSLAQQPAAKVVPIQGAGPEAPEEGQPEEPALTIGTKAPNLDIEHWFSSETPEQPIKFEKDKVYVVEFWATWCPPCVASMPHLAELQKQYADKGVTIISVSDEDTETVEAFLDTTVRGREEEATEKETEGEEGAEEKKAPTYRELTSAYQLTADPDGSTSADYMEASGQSGIPCSFIVGKSGYIEWIGHPMGIDDALASVVADTWDREAFLEEFKQQQMRDLAMQQVQRALGSGDYERAMELIEKINKDNSDPQLTMLASRLKGVVMVQQFVNSISEDQATAAKELPKVMEQAAEMGPSMVNQIGWHIVELAQNDQIDNKELLQAAAEGVAAAVDEKSPVPPMLDTIARLYYAKGDIAEAIKNQRRAVEVAKSPEWSSQLPDEMIEEMTQFLEQLEGEADGADAPAKE